MIFDSAEPATASTESARYATGAGLARVWTSRSELFLLSVLLAVPNAIWNRIMTGIEIHGLVGSAFATFEISAIVWLSLGLALSILWKAERGRADWLDQAMFLMVLVATALPIGPGTWVALTISSAVYLARRGLAPEEKAAAAIILAVTAPMFWSRRLLDVFGPAVLSADAYLVSLVTGTDSVANIVPLPNAEGFLMIATPCSSLANVSIGLLLWTTWTQYFHMTFNRFFWIWCAVVCSAVVAINVVRISLIGYFPEHYELLHGAVGNAVTSWLTTFAILFISYEGTRRAGYRLH